MDELLDLDDKKEGWFIKFDNICINSDDGYPCYLTKETWLKYKEIKKEKCKIEDYEEQIEKQIKSNEKLRSLQTKIRNLQKEVDETRFRQEKSNSQFCNEKGHNWRLDLYSDSCGNTLRCDICNAYKKYFVNENLKKGD